LYINYKNIKNYLIRAYTLLLTIKMMIIEIIIEYQQLRKRIKNRVFFSFIVSGRLLREK